MMAAILNSSILNLLPWIQPSLFILSNSLTLAKIGSHHLHKKTLHSFILTQLDDGSHLEFCWVGFRHNVFFSEIHSKTLSLSSLTLSQTNSFWLKLIHSHSTWWWQPSWNVPIHIQPFCTKKNFTLSFWLNLMMAAILNSAILDSAILHKKKPPLIHSDSTWWWWPSWILPCWIQTLPYWIQTLCYLLSDLLKNTLFPLWLWFKLIQSDSNSFILT